MNKFKYVNKNGISQYILKSLKGQQLSDREIYDINNNAVDGLLRMDVTVKKNSFTLVYDVNGFITLKQFLSTPLNKDSFARILKNILDIFQGMQNAYFNIQNVMFDLNKVMVNPATQRLYFMYVPIQSFENDGSLRQFLLQISQAEFVKEEDNSYVREYITILNNGINFSLFALEEYIKGITQQRGERAQAQKICPKCNSTMPPDASFCTVCGSKIDEQGSSKKNKVYNMFDDGQDQELSLHSKIQDDDSIQRYEERSNTQGLSDDTTLLAVDPVSTTVLNVENLNQQAFPYLIRTRNQEKIMVDKPSFRIGKERSYCDYFVVDNNAVSRSHADIITRGRRFFIMDQNSTNKTYVDGRVIPVKQEVEIFSGTEIRLANEDFTFYVD